MYVGIHFIKPFQSIYVMEKWENNCRVIVVQAEITMSSIHSVDFGINLSRGVVRLQTCTFGYDKEVYLFRNPFWIGDNYRAGETSTLFSKFC